MLPGLKFKEIYTSIISSNCVLYFKRDIPNVARDDFLQLIPPLALLPLIGVLLREIVSSSVIGDFRLSRPGGVCAAALRSRDIL